MIFARGYISVICQRGYANGCVIFFKTGLTIMRLHFQYPYKDGVVLFQDLG